MIGHIIKGTERYSTPVYNSTKCTWPLRLSRSMSCRPPPLSLLPNPTDDFSCWKNISRFLRKERKIKLLFLLADLDSPPTFILYIAMRTESLIFQSSPARPLLRSNLVALCFSKTRSWYFYVNQCVLGDC